MRFASYIICATPRSGSTLLCDLLASTGVAGKPHSYYRNEDASHWAELWGVPRPHRLDDPVFEKAYLGAMIREGTAGTGTFGLRIMWPSIADASKRLDAIEGNHVDVTIRLARAFGPTLYIHLSRQDKLAQAISLVRAEQSGLWHLAADGTERERTAPSQTPTYDAGRIAELLEELQSDDAAWTDFFSTRGIAPLRLTYETFTAAPEKALTEILSALGQDPKACERMLVQTAKLANADSLEWADRYRLETRG
ncbi:MAG: Stf0 sulfotransferase [Rhodospirillaceae bacterium]|nr:Stf0 sulfotransferase [Rhodospirillaceae bacterium]